MLSLIKPTEKDTSLSLLSEIEAKTRGLVAENEALREEIYTLCEAVGMDRVDYELFKARGSLQRVSANLDSRLRELLSVLSRAEKNA